MNAKGIWNDDLLRKRIFGSDVPKRNPRDEGERIIDDARTVPLLPCAHCGSSAELGLSDHSGHGETSDCVFVACRNKRCGSRIQKYDYAWQNVRERAESVISRWNQRA